MAASKYGKYIVTDLKAPFPADYAARYATWATRILYLDDKVVEGASQMNCSWYFKPSGETYNEGHIHDTDEIIGFFGCDPQDPHDLGGEIEFWIEDEKHLLTKSCLIFMPRGLKHCPLIMKRVDRPIFHFSTLMSGQYGIVK
jgi:hypothetical protein